MAVLKSIRPSCTHNLGKDPKRTPQSEVELELLMAHHKCENGMACINNASCSLTGAGFSQTGMAILPVKVRRRGSEKAIAMYVFLDNGSTSTYCTEALMRQLDINGAKTKISLTTLEKKDSLVDSFLVHDLEVTDLDENYIVKLPISVRPLWFRCPICSYSQENSTRPLQDEIGLGQGNTSRVQCT